MWSVRPQLGRRMEGGEELGSRCPSPRWSSFGVLDILALLYIALLAAALVISIMVQRVYQRLASLE